MFEALPGILISIALLYIIAGAALSGWLASRKGHDAVVWFFLGFFFGVIALLAVGLAPEKGRRTEGGPVPEVNHETDSAAVSSLERAKELEAYISKKSGG